MATRRAHPPDDWSKKFHSVHSPWRRAVWRAVRSPAGAIGVAVLLLFCGVAFVAPYISPYDPVIQHAGDELVSPNVRYLLGTDEFGRDILSRILYGARISLSVGLISVAIGFAFGATSGLVSGYIGGRVDNVINRLWDCLLAFPVILLGIAVVLVTGPGAVNAAIAVGISNIPIFARLARACALTEKERRVLRTGPWCWPRGRRRDEDAWGGRGFPKGWRESTSL